MTAVCDVYSFSVLAESDDWIVVDKPAPLQVHPSKPGGPSTLWHGLRALLSYDLENGATLSIINRLDRETSGVTVVTKHAAAARIFNKMMMRREVKKTYTALVYGWPAWDHCIVREPILRRGEVEPSPVHLMQMVHPTGASCLTEFTVVQRFEKDIHGERQKFTHLEAQPLTGRMHQIRVHLAHLGHSIVGDKLYGPDLHWYLHQITHGWTPAAAAVLHLSRHALHCQALRFGADLGWTAPLPAEMATFLTAGTPTEPTSHKNLNL